MDEIQTNELTIWEEYSIVCDRCETAESTRDGNRQIAVHNAMCEGFVRAKGSAEILCPSCAQLLADALNGESK